MRRQKILNDAGNLQHIDEYYKILRSRHEQPLPHLVIIIDEFAQLKRDQPEFMDELISIAAIGRTLGVHLILATQNPRESWMIKFGVTHVSVFVFVYRARETAEI